MKRIINNENAQDVWGAIVPIFALSRQSEARLIGSGFFITSTGLLVTARHVIQENIGHDGTDIGGIGVIQMYGEQQFVVRPLLHSCFHPIYDLALCETARLTSADGHSIKTMALHLTLEIPALDSPIATHSFHGLDAKVDTDKRRPLHHADFQFSGVFEMDRAKESVMAWRSRVTSGYVKNYFPHGRDSVMLPFPCFESDTPIHGGTSGGPVFDEQGRVFAVNCSRFEGTDIAFHTHIAGVLDLELDNTVLPNDRVPRTRPVRDLAEVGAVAFDPYLT